MNPAAAHSRANSLTTPSGAAAAMAAMDALRRGKTVLIAEDMTANGAVWAAAAAQFATADAVNVLAGQARGVLAVTLSREQAKLLDCAELERKRAPVWLPHYGVSVEAAVGVSTGISAEDRGLTARLLANPDATASDFVRPGHIMPAIVAERGVLAAPFGAEAAHDLVIAAGLQPAALISHVLIGVEQACCDDAMALQQATGWPLVRVSDVIAWRAHHERLVRVVREGEVATRHGPFRVRVYASDLDGSSHIALLRGHPELHPEAALVRIHSQCLTGDILHSRRCDCGGQLHQALERIAKAEVGALLYLRQEGRGIGLIAKIAAYALQDAGKDTVEANEALGFAPDERDYAVAGQILRDLGLARIVLLTNNPHKVESLRGFGIEVERREPIEVEPTADNLRYLQTKRDRMGHLLLLDGVGA